MPCPLMRADAASKSARGGAPGRSFRTNPSSTRSTVNGGGALALGHELDADASLPGVAL